MRAVSTQNLGGALQGDLPRSLLWGEVGQVDDFGVPDGTPAYVRIENGQVYVEITLDTGEHAQARLGLDGAGQGLGDYVHLEFGARVILGKVGDEDYVILGFMHDGTCRMPDAVAGVSTGAAAAVPGNEATIPAPAWRFMKLGAGQLLAIETQVGGDVLIHSAGSVELRTGVGGAIHLNGPVRLGVGPTTPPVGATVGSAGTVVPGVPAVPHVPLPRTPSIPVPYGAIVPYIGLQKGIVTADGDVQSHAAKDPFFWAFVAIVYSFPPILALCQAAGIQLPLALHSEHGGFTGPGSSHTAE
jgi:hypothetical protein